MDQYPAVGPRVPKDEFMRALGLDHQNPTHENYYRQMRVRLRLCVKAGGSRLTSMSGGCHCRVQQNESRQVEPDRRETKRPGMSTTILLASYPKSTTPLRYSGNLATGACWLDGSNSLRSRSDERRARTELGNSMASVQRLPISRFS